MSETDVRKATGCVVGPTDDFQGEDCLTLVFEFEGEQPIFLALPRKVAHKLCSGLVLAGACPDPKS